MKKRDISQNHLKGKKNQEKHRFLATVKNQKLFLLISKPGPDEKASIKVLNSQRQ